MNADLTEFNVIYPPGMLRFSEDKRSNMVAVTDVIIIIKS